MLQHHDSTSLDAMLEALSNSHRRRILLAVSAHNPRDEDEIASDTIASDNWNDDETEQLMVAIRHTHLPKLADDGYIEWNSETETIRRGSNFEEIAPLLELMVEHGDELPDDWP